MEAYNAWVVRNPTSAKRAEDLARGLSYLLPSGYGTNSSGILSETAYALINLVSVYNDRLIAGANASGVGEEEPSLSIARWALTCLASVDVVLEMFGSLSNGRDGKWKMVTGLECLRASLKLLVLHASKQRILLNGGQITRPVVNVTAASEEDIAATGGVAAPQAAPSAFDNNTPTRWSRGARTGVCLPIPSDFSQKVKGTDDLEAAASPIRLTAELMHIARPLVYLLARRVFGGRSWLPLLVSAGVDVGSWKATQLADRVASGTMQAPSLDTLWTSLKSLSPAATDSEFYSDLMASAGRLPGAPLFKFLVWALNQLSDSFRTLSPAEAAEIARRKRLWGFYLLRSPLFHVIAKPSADFLTFMTSWVPLLGMLVSYLRDMLCYFQRHYFYTSASR